MRARSPAIAAVAGLAAVLSLAALANAQDAAVRSAGGAPRTPWGAPDLQGTWTGSTSTVPAFFRCATTCVRIAGSANTYTLTTADAGYSIRASVTATGPGGSSEAKAATVLGPVKAATVGSALLAAGAASLKSSTGSVLAKASVAATGVTVKPAGKLKGSWQVWACPTSGSDWQPCTAPVKLTAKGARLKVGLDAGEKLRVIVAQRR